MLIKLIFNTLPKSYRKVEEFEDDVGQMDVDRKRTEEVKKRFQNKCVSSQNHRMKKEEGATVNFIGHFVSLPSLSGPCVFSRQAGPAAFFHGNLQRSAGKSH